MAADLFETYAVTVIAAMLVAGISYAGLGDLHTSIGDERSNPVELSSIHLKGAKVSSIDADDGCTSVNSAADLICVMYLDQRGEPKAAGALDQTHKSLLIQRRDDEEHHVCTRCLSLPQLVTRDDEIFAQQRYFYRGPHCLEIGETAAKPALLGKNADTGRATSLIVNRQRGGAADIRQHAAAWTRSLDLRDDRDTCALENGIGVDSRPGLLSTHLELVN